MDISAAGRGLHQTLLALAYLYAYPQAVLLLDESDAHLEILRQGEIYRLLTEVASQRDSQVIAAGHSEVLLNEAADRHLVIAFVGRLLDPEVLFAYARNLSGPLFAESFGRTMDECVRDLVPPLALKQRDDQWWSKQKGSEFLERLFREFFHRPRSPNLMDKSDYQELARLTPVERIPPEVGQKLDLIAEVPSRARPAEEPRP